MIIYGQMRVTVLLIHFHRNVFFIIMCAYVLMHTNVYMYGCAIIYICIYVIVCLVSSFLFHYFIAIDLCGLKIIENKINLRFLSQMLITIYIIQSL